MDPLGIDHVVDEVNSKTIPLINKALSDAIDRLNQEIGQNVNQAVQQLSNVIQGTLVGIQGIESKAAVDVEKILKETIAATIDRLDGMTLTINLRPKVAAQ